MAEADPFYVQVGAWVDKAKGAQDRIIQLAAEMALARIKELTPVKTGYLRANWTLLRGRDVTALSGTRPEDSEQVALTLQAGDAFTILNPVVYARRINDGFVGTDSSGRHYDQKGVHMVEQVATEMPEIVEKAAAIVAAGG